MMEQNIPLFFRWLQQRNRIAADHMEMTGDGFCMLNRSVADILVSEGIDSLPDREGENMECQRFFDDWFFFGVPEQEGHVYSLLKMREQEHEKKLGIRADGDEPGVTISFIAFDTDILKACLEDPTRENRRNLGLEINRVVAYPRQKHHPALKAYFIRPEAEAPYRIAEGYISYIASFCRNGVLPVPEAYREIYAKREKSARYARVPDFLEGNNQTAGAVVCDHLMIRLRDPARLTQYEKLAILATHTGNVSLHSFAAEVRYHAMFLTELLKLRLPLAGSPYASALRADMSIGDKDFQGPTPYYNLSGKLVGEQAACHGEQ